MATTQGTHEAARLGLGTYKAAGAGPLASSSLETLLGSTVWTAISESFRHLTVYIVTGPVYVENDATAADADCLPLASGASVAYPNSYEEITKLRFYAAGAYDIRFVLEA